MEAVIKVILHACKLHCGKQAPSKKEVTAVLSLLEKEGLLTNPSDLYNPGRWDGITAALSQRSLATRKVSEFKVWGLILEALKAAREEKLANQRARDILGLETGGGRGGSLDSLTDSVQGKMAPAPPNTPVPSPKTDIPEGSPEQEDTPPPPPYPNSSYPSLDAYRDEGGGKPLEECDVATVPDKNKDKGERKGGGMVVPPELKGGGVVPPELKGGGVVSPRKSVRRGGTSSLSGPACCCAYAEKGGDCANPCDSEGECGCDDFMWPAQGAGQAAQGATQGGCGPAWAAQGAAQGGCGPTAPVPWSPPTFTDWAQTREDLQTADPETTAFALPIIVKQDGPAWTPLDSKAITRLAELVKNKGLRSPVTMSAIEALMASSLLPYDVVSLMRVILEPVQYTLWYDEWNRLLQAVVAEAARNNNHPANAHTGQGRGARVERTTLLRLQGLADGMVGSPEDQARGLREGELAALTKAAFQALLTVAKVAEPVLPWSDIKQEPSESFSDFANRLIRAIEGSDLPKGVQPLVVIDCLKQKSLPDVQQIIRAAPGTLNTPGEIIKYVLDHQKNTPSNNDGLATAVQGMAAEVSSAIKSAVMMAARTGDEKGKGPCFKCGQHGHFKAQCPKKAGQSKPQGKRCQLCNGVGHVARHCRKFEVLPQGNWNGRVPAAQGPFPLH